MRIILITRNVTPNSGWGRLGSETKKAFEKREHTFEVISISPDFTFLNWLKLFFNLSKRKDVDLIYAMDLWPYGFFAYFLAKFLKKKYMINGIGTYTIEPLHKQGIKKILSIFLKKVFREAAFVPCISLYTKKQIDMVVEGANTQVVHMGLTKMNDVKPKIDILKKYEVTENSFPVLCTVGEIKHRKGQLNTSIAIKSLKTKYPNIKYLIIGKPYERYVEEIKKIDESMGGDTIHIVEDAKGDEELRAIYERADIFALNSNNEAGHFEGFGLVVLEANQFGIPAVGSNGCGIEDAIKDGENGYLCEQGDSEDIKNKIEKILEIKKQDKNYWVSRCRNWAENFSWDKTVDEYIKGLKM